MKKLILSVCFTTISCIASFAQAKKENIKVIYNTPCASKALATFINPAILAPFM